MLTEGTPEQVITGEAGWCVLTGESVHTARASSEAWPDVLGRIPNGSVDHVITDPPYEAEAHTQQRKVKRGANLTPDSGDGRVAKVELSFEPLSFEQRVVSGAEFGRVCAKWCIVFCQVEAAQLWRAALEPGMRYKRTGVWVKPDAMPQLTGDRPAIGYESIVFAHKPGRSRWNGGGRSSVFTHNKNSGGKHVHETQKPVPLMLELVELFTNPGELILDPYCGSGTTGVAALRLGRRFIGIEKDAQYAETARDRLRAEATGSTIQALRAGQVPLFGGAP